jgi:YD repeat-containing protein
VTQIVSGRDGLEARNEQGQVSRLQWDGARSVIALDWQGGLRGEFRNDRIQWANGTFWSRDGLSQQSGMEGVWYSGGDRNRVSQIVSGRDGLEARNEKGQVSRLQRDGARTVVALDWEGGLRGEFRNDRIQWANGTFWSR